MTTQPSIGPLRLRTTLERWPRATPVRITGYTFDVIEVLVVSLEKNGRVGWGEGNGVYYRKDTADSMNKQIEGLRAVIEAGLSRQTLQEILPPGGARNALDCALWDLEAKLTGRAAWQSAGLDRPQRLLTTFTCHAEAPETVAAKAVGFANARAIKLKLTGEPVDMERVLAVREALPDVWLGVDANQGFTLGFLETIMPVLVKSHVTLIEQPFPIGQEALLEGFKSPIPIVADESVQALADIHTLPGRFAGVNIKLDKCGGLTAGLVMARTARDLGLQVMVGNMCGTSLAMAPAFLVGQLCDIVDLDGPILLKADRDIGVKYEDGYIDCPASVWGSP